MEWSNWLLPTIAGAVIGYILPYLIRFVTFVVTFPFRKKLLEGMWHTYHFTRMHGETILRYEQWIIKRNLMNKLELTTYDPNNPNLKYKGTIEVEKNYLIITLRGIKHKERTHLRLFDIIPTGQDRIIGLFMGVDFNNYPLSAMCLVSRNELTNEEASNILLSRLRIDKTYKIMSIAG
ncbi:MAG: hypothetical protein AB1567_06445 [bacterium]